MISDPYPRGRIEIMGWDYDDILKARPAHPNRVYKDPLMFASENNLDRLIQRHPVVYHRYKLILLRLLKETLTPSKIKVTLNAVGKEVDRIEMNLNVEDKKRKKEARQKYIQVFFKKFIDRRKELLGLLRGKQPAE